MDKIQLTLGFFLDNLQTSYKKCHKSSLELLLLGTYQLSMLVPLMFHTANFGRTLLICKDAFRVLGYLLEISTRCSVLMKKEDATLLCVFLVRISHSGLMLIY